MKDQLIEKVREFREAFGLKQDDVYLHHELFLEEDQEYQDAETQADIADALADCVFIAAGAIVDGFSEFNVALRNTIHCAGQEGIDLPRAVDTVFTSNMSKLATPEQVDATAEKYHKLGVPVRFEQAPTAEMMFRVVCTETVTGKDGKVYPAGKLLKSIGYIEPDWSYLCA